MYGDGSTQRCRPGFKKENSASPTVSLEGVLLIVDVDAHGLRHMTCFDIQGTFLHVKCRDGDIYMILKGKLMELMNLVELKLHCKHIHYNTKG